MCPRLVAYRQEVANRYRGDFKTGPTGPAPCPASEIPAAGSCSSAWPRRPRAETAPAACLPGTGAGTGFSRPCTVSDSPTSPIGNSRRRSDSKGLLYYGYDPLRPASEQTAARGDSGLPTLPATRVRPVETDWDIHPLGSGRFQPAFEEFAPQRPDAAAVEIRPRAGVSPAERPDHHRVLSPQSTEHLHWKIDQGDVLPGFQTGAKHLNSPVPSEKMKTLVKIINNQLINC